MMAFIHKTPLLYTNIAIGINYAMFVAVFLASDTNITLFAILGIEFLLNLQLCFKIHQMHKKINEGTEHDKSRENAIQTIIHDLVTNETIEVVVPMAYFTTFTIAYYGPNSNLFMGVRNSYWGNKEIEDIGKIIIYWQNHMYEFFRLPAQGGWATSPWYVHVCTGCGQKVVCTSYCFASWEINTIR